ncbi:MAG: hypothetical protein MJ252_18210 [archaeon]|nr:hypothetical protein [archaeon]
MSAKDNVALKKKSLCDKEILEFFYCIEDKLTLEPDLIQQFISIIQEFNEQR